MGRRGLDPHVADPQPRVLVLPLLVDPEAPPRLVTAGADVDVLLHRMDGDDAERLAVFGTEHDAAANGVDGAADDHRLAEHGYLAAAHLVGAKDELHQLAATGPHQPEDAEDLPALDLERHRRLEPRPHQILHLEARLAERPWAVAIDVGQLAPHHGLDQQIPVHLGHGGEGAHELAVLEDRDGVAQGEDLVHPVRDVENDFALVTQLTDDPKQLLNLAGREAAGRLVEGDDAGVPGQRLGDLHHLPLPQRQVLERRLGGDVHAKTRQLPGRILIELLPIDDPAPGRQLTEVDVLCHRHLGHQVQLLIDDGDPALQRIDRALKDPLLTGQLHHPCGGRLKTAQDLEQSGLARAVFPHQRVYRALLAGEGDVLQRLDAGKLLADAAKLQIRN